MVAASVLSAAAIITGCDRNVSPTSPLAAAPRSPASVASVASTGPSRATARVFVSIHGNDLDSVSVTPTSSGAGLQIALADSATYDKSRDVVRLPLVLVNTGTSAVKAPARVYGWEDSLMVLSPNGHAKGGKQFSDVAFVNADSAIDAQAPSYPGAVLWRFDTLLAPHGQPQTLPAGAQSRVRWIEISVQRSTKTLSANIAAEAPVAAVPAAPIHFVIDSGVGGAVPQDTVAFVGDNVAYAFTAKAGHSNVQVRIDGLPANPSGTIVADTAPHAVIVSTDRTPVVPVGGEDLYAKAQAVLTATDVAAAYQAYLDAVYAFGRTAPDEATADRGIADVDALVFDILTQENAMRRVDKALDGYSFRIGSNGVGNAIHPPFLFPDDTGVVVFNRTPSHRVARSMSSAEPDTIEPTTFLFVNGILNSRKAANSTARKIDTSFVQPIFNHSPNVEMRLSYNHTFYDKPTPEERQGDCVRAFVDQAETGRLGINSFAGYMATCTSNSSFLHFTDFDLTECIRQVLAIWANTPNEEVDAAMLRNDIQSYRTAGRHVIVVAHSQGNLMANQAIAQLVQRNQYDAAGDSSCIGVLSLASPVSARWSMPDHWLQHIVIDGDPVPVLGNNGWARITTKRSRFVDLTASLIPNAFAQGLYRLIAGAAVTHPVSDYLADEAGAEVRKDIPLLYGACAVSRVEGGTSQGTVGFRQFAPVTFRNIYNDALRRRLRADQYSIDNPSVTQTTPGLFLASTETQTNYTATYTTDKVASGSMRWVNAIPAEIVGTWTGTWLSDTDNRGGTMTVMISGSSLSMQAALSWTDAGTTWNATDTGDGGSNHIQDNIPGQSSAQFFAGFHKPGEPNGIVFVRYFSLQTRSGSKIADGVSSDGGNTGTWSIHLTKVK
jgi:hypothetical protein